MSKNNVYSEIKTFIDTCINTIIEKDSDDYELELVYKNNIDIYGFKKIIKILSSDQEEKEIEQKKILNVFTYKGFNLNDYRLEIINDDYNNNINYFCNNENNILEIPDKYINFEFKKIISKKNNILNFNFNFKNEKKLDYSIQDDKKIIDRYKEYYNIQKMKTYRLKKRISFVYDNFRIDLSVIKHFVSNRYKLENINNIKETYEIEIEVNLKNMMSNPNPNIYITNLCQKIYIINNVLSNDLYKLNNNEKNEIKFEFINLIKNNFSNLKNINEKNCLFGPKPISLTFKDLDDTLHSENSETSLYDYKITDKADGERYNLFINKNGNVYLINKYNVLNVNRKINTIYKNTIIDGEYILSLPKNKLQIFQNFTLNNIINSEEVENYIFNYNAFDIYIFQSKKINNQKFHLEEISNNTLSVDYQNTRHSKLEKVISEINKISLNDNIEFKLKIYYDLSNYKELIKLYNNNTIKYNLDGLILLPNIEIEDRYISNIWKSNLKWKPKLLNTIDFKFKFIYVQNDNKQIKEIELYNSIKEFPYLIRFQSIQPYIKDVGKIIFEEPKNINEIKTLNGDIILDNQIVECIYWGENESNYKWHYLRIRHDKIKPNPFDSSNITFFNIFNHFKSDYLVKNEFEKIIKIIKDKNVYYDKVTSKHGKNLRSYNNEVKKILINKYMKKLISENINILDICCGQGGDIHKLLNNENFNNNKLQLLLGFDIDNNNITAKDKCRDRFIKNYNNSNGYFITADANNLPENTEENLFQNLIEKNDYQLEGDIIKEIYNRDKEFDKKLIDSIDDLFKKNDKKAPIFDFINMMFSIHYINDLRKFFGFINSILNEQGFFIFTYVDGTIIKNKIEESDNNLFESSDGFIQYKLTNDKEKFEVQLSTTGDYNQENIIYTDKIIEIINETGLQYEHGSFKNIIDTYKENDNLDEIHQYIVISKGFKGGNKNDKLDFINYILSL